MAEDPKRTDSVVPAEITSPPPANPPANAAGNASRCAPLHRGSQATEQERRRRLTIALAGVAGLMVLAAVVMSLTSLRHWGGPARTAGDSDPAVESNLTETEAHLQELQGQLADPVAASRMLSDINHWKAQLDKARKAWKRAEAAGKASQVAAEEGWANRLADLDGKLNGAEKDWDLARQLDDIRQEVAVPDGGKGDPGPAAARYAPLFASLGINVQQGNTAAASAQVKTSPLQCALVAALDTWAGAAPEKSLQSRLLTITQSADPDAWRGQVRDAKNWDDADKLMELARKAPLGKTSAQVVILLAGKIAAHDSKEATLLLRRALLFHPDDFWLQLALGRLQQSPAEKAGSYQAALAIRPDNVPALDALGAALAAVPNLDAAIPYFQKALALDPYYGPAYRNLGLALYARKDLNGAVTNFGQALKLRSEDGLAHQGLGVALLAGKDMDGALKHLQKAVEFNPNSAIAHTDFGNALYQSNNLDKAIAEFRKAVAIDPKYFPAQLALGDALRDTKDLAGALKHCQEALALAPNDAGAHNNLGNALADKKNLDGAIACYKRAIELDPKFALAHNNLGVVLRAKGDLDGAIAEYKQAIELEPSQPLSYRNLGLALHTKKNLAGAIDAFQTAIEIDPKFAPNYVSLGKALRDKKDIDAAIEAFQTAVTLQPNYAEAHFNLGFSLEAKGDTAGAVGEYETAVALNPNYAAAQNNLSSLLRAKGDLEGAIAHAKKALAANPNFAIAYCSLGLALQQQGQFAKALKPLRQGHEMGSKQSGWNYPSAQWVAACERLAELDEKLSAFLKHEIEPKDAAEQLELAVLCAQYKKLPAAAAQFYEFAFTDDSKLPTVFPHRYNAACCAALAVAGQGKDTVKPTAKQKSTWRQLALDWLKAELADLGKQLQDDPTRAKLVRERLKHWQDDPDLAAVRTPEALAKMTPAERQQWQQLWDEVAKLSQKAEH